MSNYEQRQIVLSSIKYEGDNLGRQWRIQILILGSETSIEAKLEPGRSISTSSVVGIQTIDPKAKNLSPVPIEIQAEEVDKAKPDYGVAYGTINVTGGDRQEVVVEVRGRGGRDSGKIARLVFGFETRRASSAVAPGGADTSGIHVTHASLPGFSQILTDMADANPLLNRISDGSTLKVAVTLIRIENQGQSIGPDLSFNIQVNSYGQGAQLSANLRDGFKDLEVPIFAREYTSGFDARLGIAIDIREEDPKYDDVGAGGGFIDTYLEGVQQIMIPVAAVGGDTGRLAKFVFFFKVEITEIIEDDTGMGTTTGEGTTTTGGGTTVTEEDDGDYPRDTPPPPEKCYAYMIGPYCTCIDGVYQYTVLSGCDGHCVDWRIEDEKGEPSTVARITNVQGCTSTVLILSHGVFIIKVIYFHKGEEIGVELSKEVEAHGVFHVMGDTTDAVVKTVPLVQPHPFVEIKRPAKTSDGKCLVKGSDFLVHEKKLQNAVGLLHHSDPGKRINLKQMGEQHLEIQLKMSGAFKDFFQEINRCRWIEVGQRGRHVAGGNFRKKKDFDNGSFETKIPGEDKVKSWVVVLTGTGKHEVRIIANNAIERPGTDWIRVHIDLNEDAKKEVAKRQRHLAKLLAAKKPKPNELAAHTARITNAVIAVEKAYIRGLGNPCVTVKYNYQETEAFGLLPSEMTRTQGRYARKKGPDEIPASVRTDVETHDDLITKKEKPRIYLNQKPVKNYWITQDNYGGQIYKWPDDGIIRGFRAGNLSSEFLCCDRNAPIFGVEAEVPDCVKLKSFNETILLKAKGDPKVFQDTIGQYKWSVLAKPNKEAKVEITPGGWTPASTAEMKVDTAGRYTVKVEYQLGRTCGLTYAIADVMVHKTPDLKLKWELKRIGGYSGELTEHVSLPYYQERKDDPVRAAEMLITPGKAKGKIEYLVGGGITPTSSGTGSATGTGTGSGSTTTSKDNTIGKQFEGVFVIPPDIEFEEGVCVRAYFKPYSPSLTGKDYEDFAGAPAVTITPGAPYQVVVNIETDREIHAIHLLNIRYKHVQRFKGQAIPISFAYKITEDEQCPHLEFVVLQDGDGWQRENPPFVNLIIYNRDLGDAKPSNSFTTLSAVGDAHNVPNGNLFFDVSLAETRGHGVNTELDITYNSLLSTFQDSLEFYRKLNGVPQDVIERLWARNPIGKGWTHSYAMNVHYYVVARDIDGKVKDIFAEVVAPDGNRIQFRQIDSEKPGFDGAYSPLFDSDFWLGSAEIGHGLELVKKGKNSTLTDVNDTRWKFDKFGLLEEISIPLTRNTSTKALKVENSAGRTKVTDSSDRVTTIEIIPSAQLSYSGNLKIETPDGEHTILTLAGARVMSIDRSKIQKWQMTYHIGIGQGDTCSLIKELTDPVNTKATYDYYVGNAFYGVPVDVARNFWGRLGRFRKGRTQERECLWFYEGFDKAEQTFIVRNAAGIEYVGVVDVPRLALTELRYIRKRRSARTKELLSIPCYNPGSQNSNTFDLRLFVSYKYKAETKLLAESTDIHGEKTKRTYVRVVGRGFQLKEITFPDRSRLAFEYDPKTRMPSKVYTPRKKGESIGSQPYTEYRYNKSHQVTRVIQPSVTVNGKERKGIAERWVFNSDTGRLKEYYDVNNTKHEFAYEEDGRDPQKTGLPTSINVHLSDRQLKQQMTYDKYGRETKTFDPIFGTITEFKYHKLGEIEDEVLQPIPTVGGTTQGATIHNVYDALMNHIAQISPVGVEYWLPNEHSEIAQHWDLAGHRTISQYHPTGSVSQITNPGGGTTQFSYDELDRVLRKHYDQPDARRGQRRSEKFSVVLDYMDSEKKVVVQRRKVKGSTLGDVVVENTDIFRHGRVHKQQSKTGGGPAYEEVWFEYDRWGQPKEIQWRDRSTIKRKLIQVRDEWGREIEQAHEGHNPSLRRSTSIIYYPDGRIKKRRNERLSPGGRRPVTSFTYDKIGRLLSVTDNSRTVIQQLVYGDFGNDPDADNNANIIEFSQDPSAPVGIKRLHVSQMITYNRRGLVTKLDTDVNPVSSLTKQKLYDQMGRLRREIDSDGAVVDLTLDSLGRVTKMESEALMRNPTVSLHRLDRQRNADSFRRIKTTIQQNTYAWQGELASQTRGNITTCFSYDKHGRLIQTHRQLGSSRRRLHEELAYDALDRVIHRFSAGNNRQTYTYNDSQRTVEAHWRNRFSNFKATAELNWSGQITGYRITKNDTDLGVNANYEDSLVRLEYAYNDLGDLTAKKYIHSGHTTELGRIDYRYNGVGSLSGQDITIKTVDGNAVKVERNFDYDPNLRLKQINSRNDITLRFNKWRRFRFSYNSAGYLKRYDRPTWSFNRHDYSTIGIASAFDHDARGRLTRIRDGYSPRQSPSADIQLHYTRPQRSYIAGQYHLVAKDFGAAESLKGVTYALGYYQANSVYTQDYIYDGNGAIETHVTSLTGQRGERKEDWRSVEVAPTSRGWTAYSYRRYASARSGSSSVSEYNYTQRNLFNGFGALIESVGARSRFGPFNSDFGRPPATSPQNRKLNYAERRGIDSSTNLPNHSVFITEDSTNVETTPKPRGVEIDKGFTHNAAGQLIGISHRLMKRRESQQQFISDVKNSGHSLPNYSLMFYEPDGSEMFRIDVYGGSRSNDFFLKINDAGTLLSQHEIMDGNFTLYETVPGVGVRLSASIGRITSNLHDHAFKGETYYHWNHNGTCIYLTDARGYLAADFRLSTPNHDTDLFGESFDPGTQPHVFSGMFRSGTHRNAWDFFDVAPMSLDLAMSQVNSFLERNEYLLSMAADLANPARTSNMYNTLLTPFGFPVSQPSLGSLIYHSILDVFRGIGDALTVGYASKWRTQIYDYDQDLAGIRNPMTYMAGQITGMLMSVYFSFAAVPLRAVQATWATRAALLLTVSADIVTFAHSVQAIRSGKATYFDYVGLASPLSVLGVMRIQHARNTKVINSIDKARNAIVDQLIGKGANLFKVMLRPTTTMLSDAQIIADLKKYFPVAEILKKGRKTPVKQILGDELTGDMIILSKETRRQLRKMGIRTRSKYKTVGQVDAVYRKVWRVLLKESGESLHKIAAGHRIDLGMNRYQAAFEVRMFKWAMEGLASGNPNVRQWLMDLFAKHGHSANSSVGSGVTKILMNKLDNGSRVLLEFLG